MNAQAELANSPLNGLFPQRLEPIASGVNWLNRLRQDAAARVNVLSIPTSLDEDWRFTDLSPLLKHSFQPVIGKAILGLTDIGRFILPEAHQRLVFVDGQYAPELSVLTDLAPGMVISNLMDALPVHGIAVHAHLARVAQFEHAVFTALNTSLIHDAALVMLDKGQTHQPPIHLLFIATHKEAPVATTPRCLIIAAPHSQCSVIEDYVSLDDGIYFTNAVTEIIVGEGAQVRHTKLQRESPNAFHIAHCAVTLAHDSVYHSTTVSFGARLSRYDLNVVQTGEGTQSTLNGLALISGRQLADTHTSMDHAKPHGQSTQLHKCIVDGAAHAVFNGKILVREGAQLTNSSQSSRNLLLSAKARIDTKPQLEIFADDVKCAHGATVGQLDADEIFYLKSRGLSETAARNLLTYAFAAEIIDQIPVTTLVTHLRQTVLAQTQQTS